MAAAFVLLGFAIAALVLDRRSGGSVALHVAWRSAAGACTLAAALLADLARAKNVAWRRLARRLPASASSTPAGTRYGAGRGRIGQHAYWGLRSLASADGLTLVRIVSLLHRPVHLPWSGIATVEAFPNQLTGSQGFETDMQARIGLRREPGLTVEIPWLEEYRRLLPGQVRFRSTKRAGESPPARRKRRVRH